MKSRRVFLKSLLPIGALSLSSSNLISSNFLSTTYPNNTMKDKIIFFDVNETLLDLEPLKASIVKVLGGNTDLGTLWFTTMLQYSLVVTVSKQYFDFGSIGVAALQMVAKNNNVPLTLDQAKRAVEPILSLQPHAEVKEALFLLKNHGYKLVTLTNSSKAAVKKQLLNSGLDMFFDDNISVEDFGFFKPDRLVYDLAARRMGIDGKNCVLVAAHGWDIAGAIWAGWKGVFIARKGQQLFPLAPEPEINKVDLLSAAKELVLY